jgi:hypothetical protein
MRGGIWTGILPADKSSQDATEEALHKELRERAGSGADGYTGGDDLGSAVYAQKSQLDGVLRSSRGCTPRTA